MFNEHVFVFMDVKNMKKKKKNLNAKIEMMFPGMQVVKLGGPVYRIGVGGGSASSVEVS
jgi:phosphoribosylformylglycinamidine (FGAM) synthase-like enzyme